MTEEPMTREMAETAEAILRAQAGFRGDGDLFTHVQTTQFCREYRFQGALGYGGKLWRDTDGVMRVNCYREDETPERLAIIEKTNATLAGLPEGSETR